VPDKIEDNGSSLVKLSFDSKSTLIAVKTSWHPTLAGIIQREAAILKTLNHPLILQLHDFIPMTSDHNSVIVLRVVRMK
jgi:serine/threonine protein kinase